MKSSQHQTRRAFAGALNELLDRHGLPASNHGRLQAFARLVNRPVSTAHRWLSGAGMPDVDDLFLLCDSFSCSLDELLGRCPIGGEEINSDPATAVTYFSDFGSVVINIPSSFIGPEEATRPIGVLRVVGREMSGYAEPNDRIFFDLSDTEIQSGAVFALRIGSSLMLRRLRIRLDGQIDVLCDNPVFPAETMPRERFTAVDQAGGQDIAVLGRVIAKLNREHH
ncbi:MAG TPA: XRE family transcriptional regulator [Azonexus sp.]